MTGVNGPGGGSGTSAGAGRTGSGPNAGSSLGGAVMGPKGAAFRLSGLEGVGPKSLGSGTSPPGLGESEFGSLPNAPPDGEFGGGGSGTSGGCAGSAAAER